MTGRFSHKRLGMLVAAGLVFGAGTAQAQSQAMDGVWAQAKPTSVLATADGKPVPFTKLGRQRYDVNKAKAAKRDFSFDATATSCTSPGQPRLMLTAKRFAIFVRPRMVTMLYEWNRVFRQISIGKAFSSPALADNYWEYGFMQGHPVGSWEGETLVVTSDSFINDRLLDAFLPASDRLVVTERLKVTGANTLEDRITINDPENFTRPWQAVVTYARQPDTAYPFPEDVCFDRLRAKQPAIDR